MKINKIKFSALHNEEHFQFQTEFKAAIIQIGAKPLNIESMFAGYLPIYDNEEKALLLIRKSVTSDQLEVADNERNEVFQGLSYAVKSGHYHFDPDKRLAAARLKVVFDSYGGLPRKPYNEKTAAISKLNLEIQGYSHDVETLSLGEWFAYLDDKNNRFEILMKIRYSEEAKKTELRMSEVRQEIDTVYRNIVERIEAQILLSDADRAANSDYDVFIHELNARIDKYNAILAIRKGRNAKSSNKMKSKG